MQTKTINGVHFCGMLRNGLAELETREEEINMLNVFPVPDGDTGSNMRMTLEHGLKNSEPCEPLGTYLKGVTEGMLLGARGNSGVILSQFFKGFYSELSRSDSANVSGLQKALISAYRAAYKAVVHPVEGTALTVMREGIEHILSRIDGSTTVDSLLSMYVDEMKKTLACTPEMLSVLKEEGVVDSGGVGIITIFEGMLKYFYGDIRDPSFNTQEETYTLTKPDRAVFNEDSPFEEGYCTEFVLQLMNGASYEQNFDLNSFTEELKQFGESLVVARDEKLVKVHIHTFCPEKVIAMSRVYGEFISFKMDNMQIQRNIRDANKRGKIAHKPLAVVAVATGAGVKKLFRELGCDVVIDGGTTMNVSAKDFVDAFRMTDADRIAVFPNNSASVSVAEQAVRLSGLTNVEVLPSCDFAGGYFSLAMDIGDDPDTEKRLSSMKETLGNIASVTQARASKDYSDGCIRCKKGDEIALLGERVVACGGSQTDCIMKALESIRDMEDREVCVVIRGADASEEDEDNLREALEQKYPLLDVTFINGGQEIRRWVIGVI